MTIDLKLLYPGGKPLHVNVDVHCTVKITRHISLLKLDSSYQQRIMRE